MDLAPRSTAPPDGFRFRALEPRDLDAAARVVHAGMQEFFATAPDLPELVAEFAKGNAPPHRNLYVVESPDSRVVGTAGLIQASGHSAAPAPSVPTCELQRMYLLAACRGRGMGRRFLRFLLSEARTLNFRVIRLETATTMAAARHLYESVGFLETAPCRGPSGCDRAMHLELR